MGFCRWQFSRIERWFLFSAFEIADYLDVRAACRTRTRLLFEVEEGETLLEGTAAGQLIGQMVASPSEALNLAAVESNVM